MGSETIYYRTIPIVCSSTGKYLVMHLGDMHIFSNYESATSFVDFMLSEVRYAN